MNKTELVNTMAVSCGFSKKDCETMLNAFTEIVEKALRDNDTVKLVGFGSFEVKTRAARIGRNPKTKEPIEIPAQTIPVFKAGKGLKDSVAGHSEK